MGVRTYDAAKVAVTVKGLAISGWADGTFVVVDRMEESFTKVIGADGFTSRSKTNNRSGTITLTLSQTSPSNEVLSGLLADDELNGNGVFPIMVKDISGTTVLFSGTGWIQKPPSVEFGKEISNREWVIDVSDLHMTVAGNTGVGVETVA